MTDNTFMSSERPNNTVRRSSYSKCYSCGSINMVVTDTSIYCSDCLTTAKLILIPPSNDVEPPTRTLISTTDTLPVL